jgi:hypothetical protein
MYLDLEDYRPDTPRVPTVISVREGVLVASLRHWAHWCIGLPQFRHAGQPGLTLQPVEVAQSAHDPAERVGDPSQRRAVRLFIGAASRLVPPDPGKQHAVSAGQYAGLSGRAPDERRS